MSIQRMMGAVLGIVITAGVVQAQTVPESDLSRGMTWAGVASSDLIADGGTGYSLWGSSPVISDDGKVHLFTARWPEDYVDPAWRITGEIAHFVADHPEGPFVFSDVAMAGTGVDGDWDKYSPHNPEIQRFGDVYVLLYIAHPTTDYDTFQIGMATASSPYGPWTKEGDAGLILASSDDPNHFTYGRVIDNPTLLKVGENYHMYAKTKVDGNARYAVAISSNITGPYVMEDEPINESDSYIEDACSFVQDGKVYFLTTDNHGSVTGIAGGGALWVSDDGLKFNPGEVKLGFRTIPDYYEDYDPNNVDKIYGSQPKFERPKILMLNGRPRYFYAPSGWNVTGGDRTVVHVLRIEDPLPTPPPAPGNTNATLLVNGDFEAGTGIDTNANWGDRNLTATKVPSWSWGVDVGIAVAYGASGNGYLYSPSNDIHFAFTADVSSTPVNSALWQTFNTVPGEEYDVTFSAGAIIFSASPLAVTASIYDGTSTSGSPLATHTEFTSGAYGDPATFTFVAASSQTTIHLAETSASSQSSDVLIDNVSVRKHMEIVLPPESQPTLSVDNLQTLPGGEFGFDWRLSNGRGVDIYRSTDLADDPFVKIAEDEWAETFIDPNATNLPAAFYKAISTSL